MLLYQHLFWWFGHPEVYLIFIPGTAIVSTIVATFTRRKLFGYLALVLSIGRHRVHWLRTLGTSHVRDRLAADEPSFFTAASMMIAIPTGAQFFCWIATICTGKLVLKTPMWWVFGFFFVFIIGGMTWRVACLRARGLAGARYVLRRRPLPLRADRRSGVPALRSDVLLVPQGHRPNAQRKARTGQLLALLRRLQSHLLSDAPARTRVG